MSIGRMIRPSVIASGFVATIRERRKREDQSIYGWDVTLQQESGAQLVVQVFQRDDFKSGNLPTVGEFWPVVADVQESQQYGSTLVYSGHAGDALDAIHSALSVPTGK